MSGSDERPIHTYRTTLESPLELTVVPGQPHGDVWGQIIDPGSAVTHDHERWLLMMAERAKREKKKQK